MTDDAAPTLAEHLADMSPAERAEVARVAAQVATSLAELPGGSAASLAVRTTATAVTKPIE